MASMGMRRVEVPGPIARFYVDQLEVRIYETREMMGRAAAEDAAAELRERIGEAGAARVAFAAAPSQEEMLEALRRLPGIEWPKVTAFHLDEYVGISPGHPASFAQFLSQRVFNVLGFGQVHLLNGLAPDPGAECARYARLLEEAPLDLALIGVGENGHIAFNDPPVADFADPQRVKVVELDLASRQQQVNDGCFPSLEAVPTHAMTLTVPAIFEAGRIICVVPGGRKAQAVRQMLEGPVSTGCPASILRRHPAATLYLDREAAAGIQGQEGKAG